MSTTAGAPGVTGLCHAVCRYDDEAGLLDELTAQALSALRSGGGVAVGLRPVTEVALRRRIAAELGADAVAGLIRLPRDPGPDGPSGQTDAALVARRLRAHLDSAGGPLTVLTEPDGVLGDAAGVYRCEVEAAVDVALAPLPVLLVCFVPRAAHGSPAELAERAHPVELVGGVLRRRPGHPDPRGLLGACPAPVPAALGPPVTDLPFDAVHLSEVRRAVTGALHGQGFGPARTEDVTVAVNEVATNAVHHGCGPARLMVWTPGDDVVCEVHDTGRLGDPLPGLAPPDPAADHGRGIWIARQLCDVLHVWGDDEGTHVRIRAAA
ncbi:ATP-binding protein [Pseudonocardia phyllosphaerae]|uniref:ATP-binding protein n=1 Tax=Pseudonocardia phyllosphaerae TaxID=3390502 RepID=UPI00397B77BD